MTLKKIPVILAVCFPLPLLSQPISEQRVTFPAGTSGTAIHAQITGSEITDYLLGAGQGQVMTISFETGNPSAYFNLMQGNDPEAIHIGSIAGNRFEGTLPAVGDYRIRVYLMRNAARRNETATYTLDVSIGSSAAGSRVPAPDYADGLSGGPDWWQVSGLTAGDTLNIRSGPGTANPVVGALANGDSARNLGCRMNGETRWCRIEVPGEQPFAGWAAGRYLREGPAPGSAIPAAADEASGTIPCAQAEDQPMTSCNFRVSRGEGGTASVWVTLPSGGDRYLDFRSGQLAGSDPGLSVQQDRTGDLNRIRIGGTERYELPDAVLYGG